MAQKLFCLHPVAWLLGCVVIECLLMTAWLGKEYYTFDSECLALGLNASSFIFDASPPEPTPVTQRRRLRVVDIHSAPPDGALPASIEFIPLTPPPKDDDSGFVHFIDAGLTELQTLFVNDDDLEIRIRPRRSRRQADVGDPPPALSKPKKGRKHSHSGTVETITSIEQLPVFDNSQRPLKTKTTKIKHIPADGSSGGTVKGKGRRRKQKQQRTTPPPDLHPSTVKLVEEKIEVVRVEGVQAGRGPRARVANTNRRPGVGKRKETAKTAKPVVPSPKPEGKLPPVAPTPVTSTPTPSSTTTVFPGNFSTPSLYLEAGIAAIQTGFKGIETDMKKTTQATTPGSTMPTTPPESPKKPQATAQSKKAFQNQLEEFSGLILCIARTLFDLWCCCQLIASVLFLTGVCVKSRCLLFAKLVLDALFLVVLFIYTITVIAFSVVLYVLIERMTGDVVIDWLLFGALLLAGLIAYSCIFMATLRCCEIILNEAQERKRRQRSLLFRETGSAQLLEAGEDV